MLSPEPAGGEAVVMRLLWVAAPLPSRPGMHDLSPHDGLPPVPPVPRMDFLIAFRSFDMGGGFMLGFFVEGMSDELRVTSGGAEGAVPVLAFPS